jgi:hypothetical protein
MVSFPKGMLAAIPFEIIALRKRTRGMKFLEHPGVSSPSAFPD